MKTNFFIFIFSFLLGSLLLTSCKSKPIPGETKQKYVKQEITVRDTVLVIEKDSSFYSAYIECVNGKPVLKEPNQITKTGKVLPKSKAGRSLTIPKVSLENGVLSVNCEKEAEKKFFTWKEKFIQEWNQHNIPIQVPAKLTKFQEIKLAIGSFVFWLVSIGGGITALAYLIRFIIRKKLL